MKCMYVCMLHLAVQNVYDIHTHLALPSTGHHELAYNDRYQLPVV